MKLLSLKVVTVLTMMSLSHVAMAQNTMLSEDAALENFKKAAKIYRSGDVNTEEPVVEIEGKAEEVNSQTDSVESEAIDTTSNGIAVISQEEFDRYALEVGSEYAPIEEINVSVDLENKTLEQVVSMIIQQSESQAGKWSVKWRVSPENNYIMSERVNLTAETDLSNFMSYLVDRVNNMTGIQLFVTVFDKSRIIVISDTYY